MRSQIANSVVFGIFALSTPAIAFFRLPCSQPIVTERADPIVSPGEVSGHVHTIMGGNGFGFDMTYNNTQQSTCSSCAVTKDLSNYWVPTLYYKGQDGTFQSVNQTGVLIYYLQRSDPNDPMASEGLLAFPEGFRMTAGNPMLRNYTDTLQQQAISYACLGTTTSETNGFPDINCPENLRAQVFFPSCWNGVDLDSPDHQSHMAYPSVYNAGQCPESHPHRFVSIFYEVQWETNAFADMWYGDEQPFVWSFGDPTGYGYHGDFINGWDVPTLQNAVTNCNAESGVITDCPVFDNLYFTADENNGCLIPAEVDEQVFGSLTALPGCNAVQSGPGLAVEQSGCGAVDSIGKPENPFVDLTQSKGFKYLGCGTDVAFGADRTLTGASVTLSNLTVESCVEYCQGAGFSIAGMEYSNQCYCGNSLTSGRAPTVGLEGACTMPCAGDPSENCGGGAWISLYQKCASGDACDNISYLMNTAIGPQPTAAISTVSGVQAVATTTGTSSATRVVSSAVAVSTPTGTSAIGSISLVAQAISSTTEASSSVAAFTGSEASPTTLPTSNPSNLSTANSGSTTFSTETIPTATSQTTVFLTSTFVVSPLPPSATASIATESLLPFPSVSVSEGAKGIASSSSPATGCNIATVTVTVAMSTVTVSIPASTGGAGGASTAKASATAKLPPFPIPSGNGTVAATGTVGRTGTGTASGVFATGTVGVSNIKHQVHMRRHARGY